MSYVWFSFSVNVSILCHIVFWVKAIVKLHMRRLIILFQMQFSSGSRISQMMWGRYSVKTGPSSIFSFAKKKTKKKNKFSIRYLFLKGLVFSFNLIPMGKKFCQQHQMLFISKENPLKPFDHWSMFFFKLVRYLLYSTKNIKWRPCYQDPFHKVTNLSVQTKSEECFCWRCKSYCNIRILQKSDGKTQEKC